MNAHFSGQSRPAGGAVVVAANNHAARVASFLLPLPRSSWPSHHLSRRDSRVKHTETTRLLFQQTMNPFQGLPCSFLGAAPSFARPPVRSSINSNSVIGSPSSGFVYIGRRLLVDSTPPDDGSRLLPRATSRRCFGRRTERRS